MKFGKKIEIVSKKNLIRNNVKYLKSNVTSYYGKINTNFHNITKGRPESELTAQQAAVRRVFFAFRAFGREPPEGAAGGVARSLPSYAASDEIR